MNFLYTMVRPTNSILSLFTRQSSSLPGTKFLFDTFNRRHDYLRISLTERCNLRCRYCMPKEGIELTKASDCLTIDELRRLTSIFVKSCGVSKIRLTGGEPTIDQKLVPLVEHLQELRGYGLQTIAMTTNGLTLKRRSSQYKKLGVDSINVSLDTLKPERYEFVTRRRGLELVLDGIYKALDSGFNQVKLNCVVMKGFNDDEILDFVKLAQTNPIEVRFIEFMPFSGNNWTQGKLAAYKDLLKVIKEKFPMLERVNSERSSSAKLYRDTSMKGTLGFISSMSENFCSGCNRLRITSDGNLKVCLLGREETSLRDLIRYGASDEEIAKAIGVSLSYKRKQHAGLDTLPGDVSRPMIKIAKRMYSTRGVGFDGFSHLDTSGRANMVDVWRKPLSKRTAIAEGRIFVGKEVMEKINRQTIKKGDVICVARIAGIMGAKYTSSLIPLCHQIPLDKVQIDIEPCSSDESLIITGKVIALHRTGVEMECLTAVSITLLTIYDMCKSVSKSMTIDGIKLISKHKEMPGAELNSA